MLFQPDAVIDLSDMTTLLWYIVSFFIFLLLLTIVLKIALSFAKGEQHTKFGEVFVTSLIIVLVIFIINQ